MCESTGKSVEIADSSRKGITTCEQLAIKHGQVYKLIRSNPLSLIVGFDWIDGSHNKDNRLNL